MKARPRPAAGVALFPDLSEGRAMMWAEARSEPRPDAPVALGARGHHEVPRAIGQARLGPGDRDGGDLRACAREELRARDPGRRVLIEVEDDSAARAASVAHARRAGVGVGEARRRRSRVDPAGWWEL